MGIVGSTLWLAYPSRLTPRAARVSVLPGGAGADGRRVGSAASGGSLAHSPAAALVAAPAGARRYADDAQAHSPDSGMA